MRVLTEALYQMAARNVEKIRAINRRYAEPRIAMSAPVRVGLVFLRFYLLFLVGLLGYKFFTLVMT